MGKAWEKNITRWGEEAAVGVGGNRGRTEALTQLNSWRQSFYVLRMWGSRALELDIWDIGNKRTCTQVWNLHKDWTLIVTIWMKEERILKRYGQNICNRTWHLCRHLRRALQLVYSESEAEWKKRVLEELGLKETWSEISRTFFFF